MNMQPACVSWEKAMGLKKADMRCWVMCMNVIIVAIKAAFIPDDADLENCTINIDHQLQRTRSKIHIETTKTSAGKRVIPMQDDVYECFRRIIALRKPPKNTLMPADIRTVLIWPSLA